MRNIFVIVLFSFILLILQINSSKSQFNEPNILWEKTYSLNNYSNFKINLNDKIVRHQDRFYLLFEGFYKLPFGGEINFPGLVVTDLNGNELIRHQLIRDIPNQMIDNNIYFNDITFKNDTVVIALNSQVAGTNASSPQILKFEKDSRKPFYRKPDTVLSGSTGINRISFINYDSISYFNSGRFYLVRSIDTNYVLRHIEFNNINSIYENTTSGFNNNKFLGPFEINDYSMVLGYRLDTELYGEKNILVKFNTKLVEAEIIWATEIEYWFEYGFYSELDSLFMFFTQPDANAYNNYHITVINQQGQNINNFTIKFSMENNISSIVGVKVLSNGNLYGVYGYEYISALEVFFRLDIYDTEWKLVERYRWQFTNQSYLSDIYEKENGNLLVYGGQGDLLYFAEIQPGYITSVTASTKQTLSISPLPSSDYITISGIEQGANVEIYSLLGIKQFETLYTGKIDISRLSMGVYYVKVGEQVEKFVVGVRGSGLGGW